MDRVTQRVLNRTALERQMLLQRTTRPARDVIEHLVGVQAQESNAPYVGLWCRVDGFQLDDLTSLLYAREAVRGSVLRGTQHIVAAVDYPWLRPLMQPVLERAWHAQFGRHVVGVDRGDLAAAARSALTGRTLTRPQVRDLLLERWPDRDPMALAWSVQSLLPIVHQPPSGCWNKGGATPFTLAEEWLGQPMRAPTVASVQRLIMRYLAAFGPASVPDVQTWSGLTKLREPVDAMRSRLRVYLDDAGRELFDPADADLADPELSAPVRFVPDYDNLLVGYADRTRVISDPDRARVISGALVRPTVFVDGTVAGIWRLSREGVMAVEPFRRLSKAQTAAVVTEGRRLLRLARPDIPDDKAEVRLALG